MNKLYILFLFIFFAVNVNSQILDSPILTEPPKDIEILSPTPTLKWLTVQYATSYMVELSNSSLFTSITKFENIATTEFTIPEGTIDRGSTIYWRVKAFKGEDSGDFSLPFNFRVILTPPFEIDYIKGVIQVLEETGQLSVQQGNILQNFLDQAISFINKNKNIQAINKLNICKNHISALMNGNQISESNGNMLKGKVTNVILFLEGGTSVINPDINNTHTNDFIINQNYPNPFNPETYIHYTIPKKANVVIKIYNINGIEIAELTNKEHQPGNYIVRWSAIEQSSGIYFYKITSANFNETRKMILIK